MAKNIDHKRFVELLAERFPAIASSIPEASTGLLHPEMGHLAHTTNDAIRRDDVVAMRDHFAFVDEILNDASPEVENAIVVSYLENLRFKTHADGQLDPRTLLSTRLNHALQELDAFWNRVAEDRK